MINEKNNPPKTAFNTEYETQWRKEYLFLKESGFKPTFVRIDDYGVRTYKYKKTPELFMALTHFYTQVKFDKLFSKYDAIAETGIRVSTLDEVVSEANKLIKESVNGDSSR